MRAASAVPSRGTVRATGICEASLERPTGSLAPSLRAPWLAQGKPGADDTYSVYGLGQASGNVVLQFDDGRLTGLSIEDPANGAVVYPHGRHAPAPSPWRAEGTSDERFVEGRARNVLLKVVSPPGEQGAEEARVTFEGERVRVAWRGREVLAECAWEP